MIKISKELLSEVLKEDVLSIKPYIKDDEFYKNIIMYECRKDTYDTINIYKLAHECKEWALSQGYILESLTNRSCIMANNFEYFATVKIHKETSSTVEHNINENTEIQAVINACQWIYKKKRIKND